MATPKTVTLGTAAWIFLVGAIASPTLGFYLGSWTFTSKAEQMAKERADSAVVTALAPRCAKDFTALPTAAAYAERIAKESPYGRVRLFKELAGPLVHWPGTTAPNDALAEACLALLVKSS